MPISAKNCWKLIELNIETDRSDMLVEGNILFHVALICYVEKQREERSFVP